MGVRDDWMWSCVLPGVSHFVPRINAGQVPVDATALDVQRRDRHARLPFLAAVLPRCSPEFILRTAFRCSVVPLSIQKRIRFALALSAFLPSVERCSAAMSISSVVSIRSNWIISMVPSWLPCCAATSRRTPPA